MIQDNFIKMGESYINWSSNITTTEVELLETLGTGSARKVSKYKVVVKDLIDMLLFRCHGYKKLIENEVELVMLDNQGRLDLEGYKVSLFNNLYQVEFPVYELKKLVKINRKDSTYDNIKHMPRCTMDVQMLAKVLNKVIKISIIDFCSKPNYKKKIVGTGVVITNAFIDADEQIVYITLDKDKVDLLTPDNQYNTKYLSDSFVLGSEYCKNLHSFISYYADVFKRQAWSNRSRYKYDPIAKVAGVMGVRFDPKITKYNKETHTYPRIDIVQMVKKYVAEINEKTRIPQTYGKLAYEIIREDLVTKKVKGIRFYFEEVK